LSCRTDKIGLAPGMGRVLGFAPNREVLCGLSSPAT